MKKSIGYYILRGLTWPMQLFPLNFHYVFSDILYFIVYTVFGYRVGVVAENVRNAFPEKSKNEQQIIVRKFFKNFTDMFVETLYFTHINIKKEQRRLKLKNIEVIDQLISEGRNIILIAGHFGNWEYMQLFTQAISVNKYFVYKKINNKAFDQFYRDLRGRAGYPLEMKQTFRTLKTNADKGEQYMAYFISDQRPVPEEIKHWITFLNQDTPMMLGTEKMARKTDAAVVYTELSKVRRGYHQVRFDLLSEHPKEAETYEITNTFMKRLEQSIKQYPDQYFWTHKRWKYKRKDFE